MIKLPDCYSFDVIELEKEGRRIFEATKLSDQFNFDLSLRYQRRYTYYYSTGTGEFDF